MKHILIARRYATAAIRLLSPQKYEETLKQTKSLKLLIGQNTEILKIFASAIITKKKKIEFMQNLLAAFCEGDTFWQSTLTILIRKNRGNILLAFLDELKSLLDEQLNQTSVNITLANNQDQETLDKIKKEIERTLDSKIVYDLQIDKSIIGGFIATTDSHMIDASVSSNLHRFAKKITK